MPSEFFLQTLRAEGKRLGIPPNKDRALIREYVQTRIIALLYDAEESRHLSFIGGTSLRLLRELDRFSEDLDFDNLGLSFSQIKNLFSDIVSRLKSEGFEVGYTMKQTSSSTSSPRSGSGIGDLKFVNLLLELGITSHRDEKLSVKINYTTPGAKPETELVTLTRFGFAQNVVTNTQEVLLAQKMRAILQRKDPQPRDFYDVVWFLSRNIRPDMKILRALKIGTESEAFGMLHAKFEKEVAPRLAQFKKRLQPFLLNERHISYLELFLNAVKKFM